MNNQLPSVPTAIVAEESSGSNVFTRRWPLLAAVAFVVLLVVAQFIVGATPPELGATGKQVVAYYSEHGNTIRLSVWLMAIALLPFGALVGCLRRQVRGIGRDMLLLGATAYVIEATIWKWLSASLTLHPSQLDANTARILADIMAYAGPVMTIGVILLAAPLAWASLRHENNAPSWFRWLTVVLVIDQAVETVTLLGLSGFIAPGGMMNFPVGAGLFLLWVIACGAAFPADSVARVPAVDGREPRRTARGGRHDSSSSLPSTAAPSIVREGDLR